MQLVFVDNDSSRDSYWGTVNIPDEFLVGATDIPAGVQVHFFEPNSKTWLTLKSKGKGKGFEELSAEDLQKNAKKQKAGEQPPVTPTPAPVTKRADERKTV